MKSIAALLTLATASAQRTCQSFHNILSSKPKWKDITHGKKAYNIAGNTKSKSVWITFDKEDASGNGYHIAKYSTKKKRWEETPD